MKTTATATILATLPDSPSKEQELAHLAEFIRQLPSFSYLASYLDRAEETARDAMRGDMPLDLFSEMFRKKNALREEIETYERKLAKCREEMQFLRAERDNIAHRAKRTAQYAADAISALSTTRNDLDKILTAACAMAKTAEEQQRA